MAVELRNAALLRDVRTLFGFGVGRDESDRYLLERFLRAEQPESEAAFTFLVQRHGPMVLSVCQQVLDDSPPHSAASGQFAGAVRREPFTSSRRRVPKH